MCFALVCTIGMLKFTGQSDRSKNKHMFTQSLYIHMNTSYWQWWSDFIKPRYLHLAIFFTTVNIWVRESTITFKYAQQATTTARTFISSLCFVMFFIFLNFWEQIWAELGSFWHTDQQCKTLINCEQNDCGKAKSYPQRVTTTKWRHHFLFFFHFHHDMFGTNDDSKVTKKWKKVTFWAKLSRICQGPNTYFSILSNFEQNWAILSKIEQDLPGPTNTFFSIAGHFEQNWAKLSRIYRGLQYQYFF